MNDLDDHFMLAMCGPRKSGKSQLCASMLKKGLLKKFDYVVVMCPTLDYNDDYQWMADKNGVDEAAWEAKHGTNAGFEPKFTLINDVGDETVAELITKQSECMKEVKKRERLGFNDLKCPSTLLILDDCVDSGVINFRGSIDKVAERGRHFFMSVIICAQRITAVSASIRRNADYLFLFAPWNIHEMERFLEEFVSAGKKNNMREFAGKIYETPHNFIMIDNIEKNPKKRIKTSTCDDFIKGKTHPMYLEDDRVTKKRKLNDESASLKKTDDIENIGEPNAKKSKNH